MLTRCSEARREGLRLGGVVGVSPRRGSTGWRRLTSLAACCLHRYRCDLQDAVAEVRRMPGVRRQATTLRSEARGHVRREDEFYLVVSARDVNVPFLLMEPDE